MASTNAPAAAAAPAPAPAPPAAASASSLDPLQRSGFQRLSKLVYLYRPGDDPPPPPPPPHNIKTTPRSPSAASGAGATSVVGSPKLVLLGGWMDAREAHLAKYAAQYQALFPNAAILLIRSFAYHFIPGLLRRGGRGGGGGAQDLTLEIAPAVPVLRQAAAADAADNADEDSNARHPRILIHVFSNGGSTILRHLYTLYTNTDTDGKTPGGGAGGVGSRAHHPLPPHITIFDSAPGRFQYTRSIYAFTMALPRPPQISRLKFWLLQCAVRLVCASYWVLRLVVLGRRNGSLDRTFAAHNDPGVNVGGRELRRTYIYSREDRMVDFRDVEAHAAEARRRKDVVVGEVRVERFEGTAHVAHMRGDEERYWRVVKESWEGEKSSLEG